jgi:hypothetical protein
MIDLLREWQDLASGILAFSAGVLGFFAAIWAVRATLRSESRRDQRELFSIKRALTAEIFQFGTTAFDAYNQVKRLTAMRPDAGITIHDLEEATRFPEPVIYPNTANRLGLLGDHANDVVLFFAKIQVIRAAVARIRRDLTDQRSTTERALETLRSQGVPTPLIKVPPVLAIGNENSDDMSEELLAVAETAADLLPLLTTGTVDDDPVFNFRKAVRSAREGLKS